MKIIKLTNEQLAHYGLVGAKSARTPKILTEAEDKECKAQSHEEATLHLQFCKDVKKKYPDLPFVRHEREKSRSKFMGNLFKVYNSIDGLSDWECLEPIGSYNGLYIEFKKPGEHWLSSGTVKERYAHQYAFHLRAWKLKRPAYFCNDLDVAMFILDSYMSGIPMTRQWYEFKPDSPYRFL